MVITMAKLFMAHASTHGARKLPGPKYIHCLAYLIPDNLTQTETKSFIQHKLIVGNRRMTEGLENAEEYFCYNLQVTNS